MTNKKIDNIFIQVAKQIKNYFQPHNARPAVSFSNLIKA